MRVFRSTPEKILTASQIVKEGGLVVYPTETVYGLGCDPFNEQAVDRVFRVKGRRDKPLPILALSIADVEAIAFISRKQKRIAESFWPGPLTLIVHKKDHTILGSATCNLNSVGVRVPDHAVALQLISLSAGLLVGTSANKSGENPPRTAHEAAQQLGGEVDFILDGGPTKVDMPSTILDLTAAMPKIVRYGPITLAEILKTIS